MKTIKNYIAIDCGNSSLRVVCGTYTGQKIETNLVHQVENEQIFVNGYYYWDILKLYNEILKGIRKAYKEFGEINSIGISTWGIDFALVGKSGQMLANPLCYRNQIGRIILDRLSENEKIMLFRETGISEHPMNTLYQLLGIREFFPELFKNGMRLLLIPDLLAWMLTGAMRSERSIASTTQMFDMRFNQYSQTILDYFKIPEYLFSPAIKHGESYGLIHSEIADCIGIQQCPVVCVPSHDTASAVVSIPTQEKQFAFISSGTWSLIGTELQSPIIDLKVREAGYTNEGGAFSSITLLKNSAGMFILQNIRAEFEKEGFTYSWEDLVALAEKRTKDAYIFDPNSTEFFKPNNMTEAIRNNLEQHYGCKNISRDILVASAYASLAQSYKNAINSLEKLTGAFFKNVHVVGGGCRNSYLNQLTANLLDKIVIAGPDEATSMGAIGIQILRENPEMDLAQLRKLIWDSIQISKFEPIV